MARSIRSRGRSRIEREIAQVAAGEARAAPALMRRESMTAEQFNALAERSAETLRVDDFEALLAAVRKLQPQTIVGVQSEYGGVRKIAEGRYVRLDETSPIAAPWSRRAIVEEVVPTWQATEVTPRQIDVSPQALRAVLKTTFKRR